LASNSSNDFSGKGTIASFLVKLEAAASLQIPLGLPSSNLSKVPPFGLGVS
jgi:hypothetical protein